MDNTSHLCAQALLENLLENLFGKNYDMESKVLLFTQTHTADEHSPRSQVDNALSIGGYQGIKQKA
jgi:hypothetical protein